MSPGVRYLSTTLALVAVAVAYVVLQRPPERPAPRPPARSSAPAVRPVALPPAPITARELLDRAATLDLRQDQVGRLQALDRRWRAEARELEEAAAKAQQEFSAFMNGTGRSRGPTVQEIQRRSAEFSSVSAALRESRQRHADAAIRLLADWQRTRLSQMERSAPSGGLNEARKN